MGSRVGERMTDMERTLLGYMQRLFPWQKSKLASTYAHERLLEDH